MKKQLNLLNSGDKDTLEEGDSLLLSLQKTKSEAGLVQIRLLEIVRPDPEQSGDLKLLFQSMTRYYDPKPRHAWIPIGLAELEAFFGIKVSERDKWKINDKGKEELELNILNPTFIASFNKGKRLRVQVRESIYPKDEWQADNASKAAKKNPSTGQKIYHEGQYIFANCFVVTGTPQHQWIAADQDYREAGTFKAESNDVEFEDFSWSLPEGVDIPKSGKFEDLREVLNKKENINK
tara:strand:+ start:1764 stop:2471 length:708 start_codon:yes stop_codon:yes gene_type:complete